MYTEISSNKTKSVALIFGFLVFVIGLGWLLSYAFDRPYILPIAIIIATVQAFVSYFYADKIALSTAGAQEAPRQEPFLELHRLVENLSITAGVPKQPTPGAMVIALPCKVTAKARLNTACESALWTANRERSPSSNAKAG